MAPRPGGPGGPGRGPGGPGRGPGGPGMGPRGFGGPARWHGGPPSYKSNGTYQSGGESITAKLVGAATDLEFAGKNRRRKFGFFKGTILGLKLSTTGTLKEELFKASVGAADELYQDKRITLAEARKRKMEAATKYFGYLFDIGFYDQVEYDREMQEFATEIGATYTPTTRSRTR